MSRRVKFRHSRAAVLAAGSVLGVIQTSALAAGVSIGDYHPVGSFTLPEASSLYSPLASGSLVVLDGAQVLLQNGIDSSSFSPTATTIPTTNWNASYPSFVAASPTGTQVAAGDGNGNIAVFSASNPGAATIYTLPNASSYDDYTATWFSSTKLAITDANNGVDVLDTVTGKITTVIGDIDGASAGVAFDKAGNLYTGDGYYYGGGSDQTGLASNASQTGLIKVFSAASWQSILPTVANPTAGTALDFQANGTTVAQLLSANSLGFDNDGNFFIGGADSYGSTGDYGYDTLVSASAIQTAAASQQQSIITGTPSSTVRDITDPYDTPVNQGEPGYWNYNPATSELYLQYSDPGDATVEIYSAVPEPTGLGLLTIAGIGLLGRRRRDPSMD